MYCKRCGTNIPEKAKFCPKCGETVRVNVAKKKKSHKVIALILSMALVIGACSGVFVFREEILSLIFGNKDVYSEVDNEDNASLSDDEYIAAYSEIDYEVNTLLSDNEYMKLDIESQKSEIEKLLGQMANKGLILEESIEYDEESEIFWYTYTNNAKSGIMMKGFDDDFAGNAQTNDYVTWESPGVVDVSLPINDKIDFDSENYPYSKEQIESLDLKSLYMYGWSDRNDIKNGNATLYNRYLETQKEWNSNGLKTDIDDYCTVEDFKTELIGYDLIIICEHGNFDKNYPLICLQEPVTIDNLVDYRKDFESGTILSVRNPDTKVSYWWITPSFFEKYYSGNKLEDSIIWISSCHGYQSDELVNAFVKCGAKSVIGYNNSDLTAYDYFLHTAFVYSLMYGDSVQEALEFAQSIWKKNDTDFYSTYHGTQTKYGVIFKKGDTVLNYAQAKINPGGESCKLINEEELVDDESKVTSNITDSAWQEACKKTLESFYNSDEYIAKESTESMWDLYDINLDNIPELIISKGSTFSSACYVYVYNGTEFEQLSAINNYGNEQEIFGPCGLIYVVDGRNGFAIHWIHMGLEYAGFFNLNDTTLTAGVSFENNSGNAEMEDVWYKYNNNIVSESEYNSAFESYRKYVPDTENSVAKAVGRKYSFDNYEYILSTYESLNVRSGKCGNDAYWSLDSSTGTLTISGTGDMYDYGDWAYDGQSPPWCLEKDYGSNIKNVIIEEGITRIGEMCFFCSAVSNVQLPESLKSIGMLAFHECKNLKEITISANVTQIEDRAFGQYGNGDEAVISGFVTYGYNNSEAQKYCTENGISFKAVDGDNIRNLPDDYVSYGESCYFLFDTGITSWEEAETYCESLGGHLAVISNKEENDFLFNYMKQCGYKSAYFGYSDSLEEGTWTWVDGENSSYENWSTNEPNHENANEDYAMFYYKYTDGAWNDGDFGNKTNGGGRAFICEWNMNS